ncbi:MAG: LacI family DNA-binding transcriptional regulator [Armatimonadetes bacterium]|nr:LacI family DNA-binding transcriptional regulator [Armatimonadota bacterium]MDE2205720.1 LacI family DNA-binding transcriptional regulator [Armatimonadota bacterium]
MAEEEERSGPHVPTTLQDIADVVGVSASTVSAVLHTTRSTTRVSKKTRERVESVARQMDYQPNAIARSLRRRETGIIGIYNGYGLYCDARSAFLGEIIGATQVACQCYTKDCLLYRYWDDPTVEGVAQQLVDGRVDGLILYAPEGDALAERLARAPLPVVAVVDALPSLPCVVVNDQVGGALQAKHIASRGHKRVLYRQTPHRGQSVVRRFEAFRDEAQRLGLDVVYGRREQPNETALGEQEKQILSGPAGERPTAIVAWEDLRAYQAVRECEAMGLRVPEDIAVIGYDGVPTEGLFMRKLTTIRAPWSDVATRAMDLLIQMIAGKRVPEETVLDVELVLGTTT